VTPTRRLTGLAGDFDGGVGLPCEALKMPLSVVHVEG